jgi:hypothetical protein
VVSLKKATRGELKKAAHSELVELSGFELLYIATKKDYEIFS